MLSISDLRRWTGIGCLALLAAAHQAQALPLPIAAEDDAGPWSYRDGTGLANDEVQAAFRAVGVGIQMNVMPYARCKDYVERGKMAAAFSMSWVDDLKGKVLFPSQPLFICHSDFFYKPLTPLTATDKDGFAPGTKVGVVIGYEYPPLLYDLQARGSVVLEGSESEDLNLKKLMLGRIDSALLNYNEFKPVSLMLAKAGVQGPLQRAFSCGDLRSYIGFSVKHPRGRWARKKFELGFERIRASGELRQIEERWMTAAQQRAASMTPQHE